MKPSDLANKIANRNQREAQVKTGYKPEYLEQIDQAWEAIRPVPVQVPEN